MYDIMEQNGGTMVVVRTTPDGRRSVVGGKTTAVGSCYESAWSDYFRTYSKLKRKGNATERVLISRELRPTFRVEFVAWRQNTLQVGKAGAP